MKGIILAGGSGTRLHPITLAMSKQLMPVYDKPMVYYPLSVLLMAGISDILIISTPQDLPHFKKLLNDGSAIGCKFSYAEQAVPNGLAQAFVIGKNFIGKEKVALILGDNIFYGTGLQQVLQQNINPDGGVVFAYHVSDPERYGVVEFDKSSRVISIEEKPKQPKSSYAVPGLYLYDHSVVDVAEKLKPSARGEYEITDYVSTLASRQPFHVVRAGFWYPVGTEQAWKEAEALDLQSVLTADRPSPSKVHQPDA